MVRDDLGNTTAKPVGRGLKTSALVLFGVVVPILATSYLMARWLTAPPAENLLGRASHASPALDGERLFANWPAGRKPDVVLVLSAQEHGYMQPCGCSRPQLGGLERRFMFLQSLRQRGWPVVPLDLGDILDPTAKRTPQALVKYRRSMEALKLMGYGAVAVGGFEMELPLLTAIAHYSLNDPQPPLLAANLQNRETNFAGTIGDMQILSGNGAHIPVGVTAAIGPSVAKEVKDPLVAFASNKQALADALQKMGDKVRLRVLLYQGSVEEARVGAQHFPQFDVILCLTEDSEAPPGPTKVGNTLIVEVGHKGRYVGVVGAFANPGNAQRPYELHYQLVRLSEDYLTPEGKESENPVHALMTSYAEELKSGDYLSKYEQRKHPLQVAYPEAEFVGSRRCRGCHKGAYEVWENSAHAHAYQTLVDVEHPPFRQFDGECVSCHVTGFGYQTGFRSEKHEEDLRRLKDVGCENCHGPGSAHVMDPDDEKLRALMNPFRPQDNESAEETKRRLTQIDLSCQKCHDIDNDVHWNFDRKWPKIIHRETRVKKGG